MGKRLVSGTAILIVYMLPSLLVTGAQLGEYYYRICAQSENVNIYAPMEQMLEDARQAPPDGTRDESVADGHLSPENRQQIVNRIENTFPDDLYSYTLTSIVPPPPK